jgi:2-C-methyl-D-erythritol 4-phosphate cytidylyltransferase
VSTVAIVVAAGRGTRMGTAAAKAFLSLGGVPLLVHSLRTLTALDGLEALVLVVAAAQRQGASRIIEEHGPWRVPIRLTEGGTERQDSVAAGLRLVEPATDLVLIHDAARPFVLLAHVEACVKTAAAHGAAILAVPARDTVKLVGGDSTITETIDRRRVWLAQTPQVFNAHLLQRAYAQARRDGYIATDDAALVERLGHPVRVVPGDVHNLKITTPDDLRWAEWYLQNRTGSTRGGTSV